jgi:hypothetical protein
MASKRFQSNIEPAISVVEENWMMQTAPGAIYFTILCLAKTMPQALGIQPELKMKNS